MITHARVYVTHEFLLWNHENMTWGLMLFHSNSTQDHPMKSSMDNFQVIGCF